MPRIACLGAASRIALAAADTHNACERDPDVRGARRGALFRGDRGERVAGEDVAQRAEHSHDRGEHAAARRDRDALPADDALRPDRKRRTQIAGVGAEQVDRELLPQRQPEQTRGETEHNRVEQQHGDDDPRRVAVAAKIGDQAPALGDGQEHGVEREQEADEGADHGEQRGRLVARGRGLREQPFVVARALHVQATDRRSASRQAHKRGTDPAFHAGGRLYEDAADAAGETRHFLGVEQRRDDDRARHQPPDLPFVELLIQRRIFAAAEHPQRHFAGELGDAEVGRERCWDEHRADAGEGFEFGVAHERAAELLEARVGADELHRFAALWAARVRAGFQQGRGDTDIRDGADLGKRALGHAVGVAREQLQRRVADDPAGELSDRARQALAGDLGGEQQRHASRDPDDREALLHEARTNTDAIQMQHVSRLHAASTPVRSVDGR